jgi:hypothetical protein
MELLAENEESRSATAINYLAKYSVHLVELASKKVWRLSHDIWVEPSAEDDENHCGYNEDPEINRQPIDTRPAA